MEIAIIGAGIGGLTTALALKKASIPFRVYEAATELKPVGAGIMLASNAMTVYNYFGIADQLRALGITFKQLHITDAQLNIL